VAESLGILLYAYIGQLVIGTFVVGAVLLRRLRHPLSMESGWRARRFWIALTTSSLSIVADACFLFATNKSPELGRQTAVFCVSCLSLAFALALTGKGPGRILIPIVSTLFALPWLPFIQT
jgi:hypothetical protein